MSSILEGCNTSSRIRALLASRKNSQDDLAKLFGVGRLTITLRLKQNSWSVKELEKIAEKYGVDKQDLI